MKPKKTLENILAGSKNVKFDDFTKLVEAFGFRYSRANGSHCIYTHPNVEELVNLQKVKGEVKPYQVKQFLKLVEKHDLTLK
jgi:predicted RNA binding protein YcfA (HicA-like mRNA interferase family)